MRIGNETTTFTCAVCKKVFIVSALLHHGRAHLPRSNAVSQWVWSAEDYQVVMREYAFATAEVAPGLAHPASGLRSTSPSAFAQSFPLNPKQTSSRRLAINLTRQAKQFWVCFNRAATAAETNYQQAIEMTHKLTAQLRAVEESDTRAWGKSPASPGQGRPGGEVAISNLNGDRAEFPWPGGGSSLAATSSTSGFPKAVAIDRKRAGCFHLPSASGGVDAASMPVRSTPKRKGSSDRSPSPLWT
jgi:hypothetical protein